MILETKKTVIALFATTTLTVIKNALYADKDFVSLVYYTGKFYMIRVHFVSPMVYIIKIVKKSICIYYMYFDRLIP